MQDNQINLHDLWPNPIQFTLRNHNSSDKSQAAEQEHELDFCPSRHFQVDEQFLASHVHFSQVRDNPGLIRLIFIFRL